MAWGNATAPFKKGGPSAYCAGRSRPPAVARAAGSAERAPLPHPWQEVAGRGRRGPRRTRGALPHWPRAAPTAGRGTRGRAGAGPDTPPPAGALHLAAAGERPPCPCPALRWPPRPLLPLLLPLLLFLPFLLRSLLLLLAREAAGCRQRAIPAAAPVSFFSLCPSGTGIISAESC